MSPSIASQTYAGGMQQQTGRSNSLLGTEFLPSILDDRARRVLRRPACFECLTKAPDINGQIQAADRRAHGGNHPPWDVGIDDLIYVVEKEAPLIRLHPCTCLEILLCQRKWAWPGSHFDDNSPDQRHNMERTPDGPSSGESCTKDYRQNPKNMNRENCNGNELHPLLP